MIIDGIQQTVISDLIEGYIDSENIDISDTLSFLSETPMFEYSDIEDALQSVHTHNDEHMTQIDDIELLLNMCESHEIPLDNMSTYSLNEHTSDTESAQCVHTNENNTHNTDDTVTSLNEHTSDTESAQCVHTNENNTHNTDDTVTSLNEHTSDTESAQCVHTNENNTHNTDDTVTSLNEHTSDTESAQCVHTKNNTHSVNDKENSEVWVVVPVCVDSTSALNSCVTQSASTPLNSPSVNIHTHTLDHNTHTQNAQDIHNENISALSTHTTQTCNITISDTQHSVFDSLLTRLSHTMNEINEYIHKDNNNTHTLNIYASHHQLTSCTTSVSDSMAVHHTHNSTNTVTYEQYMQTLSHNHQRALGEHEYLEYLNNVSPYVHITPYNTHIDSAHDTLPHSHNDEDSVQHKNTNARGKKRTFKETEYTETHKDEYVPKRRKVQLERTNIYTYCIPSLHALYIKPQNAHILYTSHTHSDTQTHDDINIHNTHTHTESHNIHKKVNTTTKVAKKYARKHMRSTMCIKNKKNIYTPANVQKSALKTHKQTRKRNIIHSNVSDMCVHNIYTYTQQEKRLKQKIEKECTNTPYRIATRKLSYLSLRKRNVNIETIRAFNKYFPTVYSFCTHGHMPQCFACNIVHTCNKKANGNTIISRLVLYNMRIPQLCSPVASCILLLKEHSGIRHTIAHDKYIHNIKVYILSSEKENDIIVKVHQNILTHYRDHNNEYIRVHNINANIIKQNNNELTQIFMHRFVMYIKEDYIHTREHEQEEQKKYIAELFDEQQTSTFHKVELNTYAMKRDMLEYSDRVKHIKQNMRDDNRAIKGITQIPFVSCVFFLFSTSEIFDMLLKDRQIIECHDFVHAVRIMRASAADAHEVKLILTKQKGKGYKGTSIMFGLDIFRYDKKERELKVKHTTDNDIMRERKKYMESILNIYDQINEDKNLLLSIKKCIKCIDTFLRDANNMPIIKSIRYKQTIIRLYTEVNNALKKHMFSVAAVPKQRYKKLRMVSYNSCELQDICDQIVVLDAVDTSLLHTFHIMKQPFCVIRNIMLHVILNILFFGNGGDDDIDTVIYQYDNQLIRNLYIVLTEIQINKVHNLHTLLLYERNYLQLTEFSHCVMCNIFHVGHYVNLNDEDICISKLCFDAALRAMHSILPSAKTHICASDILTHSLDQDNIVKIITNKLIFDRNIDGNTESASCVFNSLLDEKIRNIFNLPEEQLHIIRLSLELK